MISGGASAGESLAEGSVVVEGVAASVARGWSGVLTVVPAATCGNSSADRPAHAASPTASPNPRRMNVRGLARIAIATVWPL